MKTTIHSKIHANVCLSVWRVAPENTKKQKVVKRLMIDKFMSIKRK